MNTNLELGTKRDCNTGSQRQWIRGIMSLGMSYVFVRSAESVVVVTYATMGMSSVLLVLSSSLVYLGMVVAIAKLGQKHKNANVGTLSWLKEVPYSLALGIIALIVNVWLEHSDVEPKAYSLRVLVIVGTSLCLFNYLRDMSKLFRYRRGREIIDMPSRGEVESNMMYDTAGSVGWWSSLNARVRVLLVATYVLDSVIWTWLVINYRYYSHSFLGQSLWIMASLWIFLSSCWLHCANIILVAYRWAGGAGQENK